MSQEKTASTASSSRKAQELNGSCFVVVMPVSEQEDITGRGVWGIQSADMLVAPHEKAAATLLKRYAVSIPITGLSMENLDSVAETVFEQLRERKRVTILTDPLFGITEPVLQLVNRIREAGKEPRIMPGVDLAATALAMSGFSTDRYFVAGHIPTLWGPRSEFLQALVHSRETTIFFASGARLNSTFISLEAVLPHREVVVIVKPTIPGEAIFRGTITSLQDKLTSRRLSGTVIFVLAGAGQSLPVRRGQEEPVDAEQTSQLEREDVDVEQKQPSFTEEEHEGNGPVRRRFDNDRTETENSSDETTI